MPASGASPVTGRARLGRRTKQLVKRLQAGDIAVIDHVDLDRVSAEELLASGVRAVVNVAPSQSGRYPNPGPAQSAGAAPFWRRGVCSSPGRSSRRLPSSRNG